MVGRVLLGLLLLSSVVEGASVNEDQPFIESLISNFLSYALVILPAAYVIKYFKQHPEKLNGGGFGNWLGRLCILGPSEEELADDRLATTEKGPESPAKAANEAPDNESWFTKVFRLSVCVLGLQGSYLTWGVLQEYMMTQSYGRDENGNEVFFRDSQFLVFVNRVLALVVSFMVCRVVAQPKHTAPLYKYGYPSVSNVMSSWCQYEALKYVSFPTQVLAKATKVIPVMLMGRVVQGKSYPTHEYVTAILISIGVSMFLFSRAEEDGEAEKNAYTQTSFIGLMLLTGYMVFDSFTSNYQSLLFKQHKMSSYQMMFGVNIFSTFFTVYSLLERGTFMNCIFFTLATPKFAFHVFLLSLTSATGQVFIYRTLSIYGALVFTIIMTTRQVISIFLSALFFGHSFDAQAWVGIMIVFIALFSRTYFETQEKKNKAVVKGSTPASVPNTK